MLPLSLSEHIAEVFFTAEELDAINRRLGEQITKDYQGKNLCVVGVLKGSLRFMADLIRYIDVPCEIDFLSVSSYGNGTTSSGEVRIIKDLDGPLQDKDLLVVEDILDSGITLSFLLETLSARHPRSIRLCTLLDKPARRRVAIKPDYVGAEVEDQFIVGYGLDFSQKYRNLPYIGVLRPEIYEEI